MRCVNFIYGNFFFLNLEKNLFLRENLIFGEKKSFWVKEVHFSIISLVPPIHTKKVEIFTPSEAFT